MNHATGRIRRLRDGGIVVVTMAAAGALAAACGGGTPSGSAGVASLNTTAGSSAAAATGAARSDAASATSAEGAVFLRYTECMRTHGEPNFPAPVLLGNGVTYGFHVSKGQINPESKQFQQALAACRSQSPHQTNPTITPADQVDYLKAVQCMRNHGVIGFPDPTYDKSIAGGVGFDLPPGMNPDATKFVNARLICEKLIPPGLPYSS